MLKKNLLFLIMCPTIHVTFSTKKYGTTEELITMPDTSTLYKRLENKIPEKLLDEIISIQKIENQTYTLWQVSDEIDKILVSLEARMYPTSNNHRNTRLKELNKILKPILLEALIPPISSIRGKD